VSKTGVVIPVGPGRRENLAVVLRSLAYQNVKPRIVVLVCDGEDAWLPDDPAILEGAGPEIPVAILRTPKHEPGMEQPRNIGTRLLTDLPKRDERFAGIEKVWFLDTDVIVVSDALERFELAAAQHPKDEQPVLIGPYDWMAPGEALPYGQVAKDDDRWPEFEARRPWEPSRSELSMGLACFSGNLVWPIDRFQEVGGFWNELHHGRCEDGELGLRAVAMGVPIAMVKEARGFHIHHPRNMDWIQATNDIDVPKIKERHGYKELGQGGEELFVVEEDGHRFNVRCRCGWEGNTAEIWNHQRECTS
jgi:GT2 family glycosyltransferase